MPIHTIEGCVNLLWGRFLSLFHKSVQEDDFSRCCYEVENSDLLARYRKTKLPEIALQVACLGFPETSLMLSEQLLNRVEVLEALCPLCFGEAFEEIRNWTCPSISLVEIQAPLLP